MEILFRRLSDKKFHEIRYIRSMTDLGKFIDTLGCGVIVERVSSVDKALLPEKSKINMVVTAFDDYAE